MVRNKRSESVKELIFKGQWPVNIGSVEASLVSVRWKNIKQTQNDFWSAVILSGNLSVVSMCLPSSPVLQLPSLRVRLLLNSYFLPCRLGNSDETTHSYQVVPYYLQLPIFSCSHFIATCLFIWGCLYIQSARSC